MSNNKFHKILSDTITLPLLPADASTFNKNDTDYYAVLVQNYYIPVNSSIECIYKPDWITEYKFISEGEKSNETNDSSKYYNKLFITSISDNTTKKLRRDVMEFAIRNNVNSQFPINHIYAKVSQAPKEDIEVHLEFIPTENQKPHLNENSGEISGDEQELHIKYWAVLNGRNQSNVTLTLDGNSLDRDKINSLKINSSNNTVELVYLIDENIEKDKLLKFKASYKTQYNSKELTKTITQKKNEYTITLNIDNPNSVVFNGDNRILTYSCTYKNGINNDPKDVKDNLYLEFSYITDQNELKYNVIKTIYDTKSNSFKTTIKVYENYTNEERKLNVKAVYNGSNRIESNSTQISQNNASISLQYYVEYLDRDESENPTTTGTYNVSAFGETIRLHYYGLIPIGNNKNVKITSITNTKNNITTTNKINALINGKLQNNVTLNNDAYILDIKFDRNESTHITKNIEFKFDNLSAQCTLTQGILDTQLELNNDRCTKIIGGIPEYNNIILTFRAFDKEKYITVEDVNLYDITCDNTDVNLQDIQYKIITYDNINYVVASNIRCNNIYDKKTDRILKFTVKYNTKTVSCDVTQKTVKYACKIEPTANHVSGLGETNFKVTSLGITYDGYQTYDGTQQKYITSPVEEIWFINTATSADTDEPDYITVNNKKLLDKTESIISVEAIKGYNNDKINGRTFFIRAKYKETSVITNIKQLSLQLYIEFYKDENYSELSKLDINDLYISPFINNIIYYKCYLCEINGSSLERIDLSPYQIKGFDFSNESWVDVNGYADQNPTYNNNENEYSYTGKITIPRYICSNEVTYRFTYIQGYSTEDINLYLSKTVNIHKPQIYTCTDNDSNPVNSTYIQYRTDKDYSYNVNKSILKIGTENKRIPSTGYQVTLYYRVVFKLILHDNANYIYGDEHKTYIDLDKTHFISFVNEENITIDKDAFLNADETYFDNSKYLKIIFDVNKNDSLSLKNIYKCIEYQFTTDNINGTDYKYGVFSSTTNNSNNRIEIYQAGASLDLKAFFDDKNYGEITDNGETITYNAKTYSNQNLHVQVLLNDVLQQTLSSNFIFLTSSFQITDGILDTTLNTYKSEYNLDDLYIETSDKTYKLYYHYNDNISTNILTVIRKSFAKDENCELKAKISQEKISNTGENVTITFWLEYTDGIIDLGENAKENFTIFTPGNNFTVEYNETSKKYSFDYYIDANPSTSKKTYTFRIKFGDKTHKQELTCTQVASSYALAASITPDSLPSLDPGTIIITCYVVKDDNGKIYQDVDKNNFNITQTNETDNKLTESSEESQNGQYVKKYKVPDNNSEKSITYEFECVYNLNGQILSKPLTITQSSGTLDVLIYDAVTDQSIQGIVNPVGETKKIKYCGLLNSSHITTIEDVKFLWVSQDFINKVYDPVTIDDYIQRDITFGLNNSSDTITYTFTAEYKGKTKSITLTQESGLYELHVGAYYMRGSTKIEDIENELDLKYDDSDYFYVYYYAQVKNGTDIDLDTSHYTVTDSTYSDRDMTYEKPINFAFIDTTVDNVNNRIVNKYRFSENNIDSYDFERYVNFKITYYIESVEYVEVLVMQDSSFSIGMGSFDFLIFRYDFLNGNLVNLTQDEMNSKSGHDLDTITHITTATDTPIPYENIDASNNKTNVFINYLTAGFGQTVSKDKTTTYKDIILFGGDNIAGNYESVYINIKNIITAIEKLDKKTQRKCRKICIDLYGHWYAQMGTGRVKVTYNTYDLKDGNPNLTLHDHIYSTTNAQKKSEYIDSVVLDKGNSYASGKDHYTLLGRLTYDIKTGISSLTKKTLYGYTYSAVPGYIGNIYATYYKFDRAYGNLDDTVLFINGNYCQFFSNKLIFKTIYIEKKDITSDVKDRQIVLIPFLLSTFTSESVGVQYNNYNITSISIASISDPHLICEIVDNNTFKLKMKETYSGYNWPTDNTRSFEIGIDYYPKLQINSTEDIKLYICVQEEKYTPTT